MTTPASTFASLIRGESEGSHPMKIAGQAFVQQSSKYTSHEDAYAAGAEAMRERAAKVLCTDCREGLEVLRDSDGWYHLFRGYLRNNCYASEIRALPLTESKP